MLRHTVVMEGIEDGSGNHYKGSGYPGTENKLNMKIRALQGSSSFERYEQIKIHRTEIHR